MRDVYPAWPQALGPAECAPMVSGAPVGQERSRPAEVNATLNALDLPPHVIALQLGHRDGGGLVRTNDGHPDAAIARERIRAAFRPAPAVVALPARTEAVAS